MLSTSKSISYPHSFLEEKRKGFSTTPGEERGIPVSGLEWREASCEASLLGVVDEEVTWSVGTLLACEEVGSISLDVEVHSTSPSSDIVVSVIVTQLF